MPISTLGHESIAVLEIRLTADPAWAKIMELCGFRVGCNAAAI
jgi:hypothetical protein